MQVTNNALDFSVPITRPYTEERAKPGKLELGLKSFMHAIVVLSSDKPYYLYTTSRIILKPKCILLWPWTSFLVSNSCLKIGPKLKRHFNVVFVARLTSNWEVSVSHFLDSFINFAQNTHKLVIISYIEDIATNVPIENPYLACIYIIFRTDCWQEFV